MMARPDGLLKSWGVFFMGQKSDLRIRYHLLKRLQKDTIEAMRSGYVKALPYLESKAPPDAT